MKKKTFIISILIVFILLLINSTSARVSQQDYKNEKISFGNREKPSAFCLQKSLCDFSNFNSYTFVYDEKITPELKSRIKIIDDKEKIPVIIFLDKKDVELKEIKDINRLKRRYKLIDAVSAELTKKEIEGLKDNPHVKKIYYDHILHVLPIKNEMGIKLTTSVKTIGAYYVQNFLNYTGRNVTVAVIDTGIDYTHPDLGGCLGNGCKVKDGYDFINGDSDPIDDNGHGTHCAGIVAANGNIKGVAPDTDLLAVKVMDNTGQGSNSVILAGIDWAVANGADIITLSLGDNQQPNDGMEPLDLIVNAAVEKGVVVVVAVGNEGPGTGTIGYPASAEKVISVGASDDKGTVVIDDDVIADFSSRGPSAFGRFDPDLVAPGVDIYSTYLGGGYSALQGTSMATPHVAGAASLLLEYNRNLTPNKIKSILIHSTEDINRHLFESGAGLINVTRAIESRIEASINNDDTWKESIIPGMNTTAILKIRNNHEDSINISLSLSSLTDIEGDYSIPETWFEFSKSIALEPGEEKEVQIKFSADSEAKPGTYGSILKIKSNNSNNSESIRIPVAITIPLFDTGIIQGTVDDECTIESPSSCGSEPSTSVDGWGDWKLYKLVSHNGTSLNINLNWSNSIDDLDLYLFTPNGILADVSGEGNTNYEHILLTNPVYHEYWIAVYAYNIKSTSKLNFNLTVSYSSSLRVDPSLWQGSFNKNDKILINFTLINDATSNSNLNLDAILLQNGEGESITGTVASTGPYSYYIVWKKSTSSIDIKNTRYLNASLRWSNHLNDLDLYFVYRDGFSWYVSRFRAEHRNDLLGTGEEDLKKIDIRYYLKKYPDVGIGIKNPGSSQIYNLTLNFTDESSWGVASINPSSISTLSPYATKSIQITVDTNSLTEGKTYDSFLLIKENSDELAKVPIRLSVNPTTTTTTSTTTTLQGECTLVGDYPPCDEVTLSEVIDLINLWTEGSASLADVVVLINAWAS